MVHTRSSSQVDQFKPKYLTEKEYKKRWPKLPPKGYVDIVGSGSFYYIVIKVKNPNKFEYTIERNGNVRIQGVFDGKTSHLSLPGPVDPRKVSHTFLSGIFECVVKKARE